MNKLEQAARQALEAIGDCSPNKALVKAAYALREALEVTEASISDHKSEKVMVSVDFMRHLEARFSYYGELFDGQWGNCRDIEELDAAHLLPEGVYQIRKILEEAPVFGFTQAHTSDKPLHHYALVLRDLDKTVEGWCEEPEFYLDGKRLYAAIRARGEK